MPLGPDVILGRQPVEGLLAQLRPPTVVELGSVRADSTAGEGGRAGGVEPMAGLPVVGKRRLSSESRGVIVCRRGSESLVFQAPLRQGSLGGNVRRSILTCEDGREFGLDGEQQVAELKLSSHLPVERFFRGRSEQTFRRRARVGKATLVEPRRHQSGPPLRRVPGHGLAEGLGRLLRPTLCPE